MNDKEGLKDTPFFLFAGGLHAALFAFNPVLWLGAVKTALPPNVIPVEFVTQRPSAFLAPVPPGAGQGETPSIKIPGPPEAEKIKKRPTRKNSRRKTAISPQLRAQLRQQRAAAAALRAQQKADAAALRAQQKAAAVARRASALALKRLQAEQAAQRLLAQQQARARNRAEVSRELALLENPDHALEMKDAVADAPREVGAAALAAEKDEVYEESIPSGKDLMDRPSSGAERHDGEGLSWSIEGPVGSRRILRRPLPNSPEWVSRRGLELSVQIKFQVMEDGSVKTGAVIKKTSGFPEIDRLSLESLRTWKFEAIPPGETAETWGSVVFRFTMG